MEVTLDTSAYEKPPKGRRKGKKDNLDESAKKRRCISSACVPCRKRKSKCDGRTPACSACAAVYNTECVYDINSDHRRKGVYRKDMDTLKTRNSTLQTLIQAILNYPEDEVAGLVRQIRTCESLDAVADAIVAKENGEETEDSGDGQVDVPATAIATSPTFESQLSANMGELRLEDGSTRYIGGTSHLIYMGRDAAKPEEETSMSSTEQLSQHESLLKQNPLTSWTTVTSDPELVQHLINMYFCWHYTFFTTLSKSLFYKDFLLGNPPPGSRRKPEYCSPLLVNAMLALGCHFTSRPGSRAVRGDSATAGDHFFKEAKRLILEGDLHEIPALTTVQALALMSVREAGCGREAKGWVYSGMSFRMACDLGLNLDSGGMHFSKAIDETEEDARRITFWGCFLFDKCWSNYLGRLPQLPNSIVTVPKCEVFPTEDAETWAAYTDSGFNQAHAQPSRTRAVALQITKLCGISSDLMNYFYNPLDMDKVKGKQTELKKLSEIHQRLETWRRELPKELEPKEGGLPSMLVMHMFFQLLYIHLFRPFLKYNPNSSPLPSHVSPRKLCTTAAQMISKLLRLYKRSHGLRQICNVAVYIAHSACTIHLLNLPEKNAKRDIIHGVKHLEEIAESWLCARRTLGILSTLAKRWKVELPEDAATVLARTDAKFGRYDEINSPKPVVFKSDPSEEEELPAIVTPNPNIPAYTMPHLETANTVYFGSPRVAIPNIPFTQLPTATTVPRQTPEPQAFIPSKPSPLHTTHTHPPRDVSTPASANAPQVPQNANITTTTTNSSGNSPSQFYGGVEQLIPGQDWWLRDQSQLATGFDNWNLAIDDYSWPNTQPQPSIESPASVGRATGFAGPASPADAATGAGQSAGQGSVAQNSGVTNAGGTGTLGNIGNAAVMNGFNGYGGALHSYNEQDWYL